MKKCWLIKTIIYYTYRIDDCDRLQKIQIFIHMNPVRNKLAKKPDEYPYTSFRFYAGDTREFSLLLDEIGN